MTNNVSLLNPGADGVAAQDMLKMLKTALEEAEKILLVHKQNTYEDYCAAFVRVDTLRRVYETALKTYGRHFRV